MSKVEITFKSGATITADVSTWTTKTNPTTGAMTGYRWTNDGTRWLQDIDVSEVVAVVFVDEEQS